MDTISEGTLLWEPSAGLRENANITRYMAWLKSEKNLSFADYSELWKWSVDELEEFWASSWEYFEVESSGSYEAVLKERKMPGAAWFAGTDLNYAEHVFRKARPDEPAVMYRSELRSLGTLTWGELRERVAELAAGLRSLGIKRGDRVVAYVPNSPEALVAFLACASIGAVWSSSSPDFGARRVVERFGAVEEER